MPLKMTDELEAMRTRWLSSQPPTGRQAREDVAELFRVLDAAHAHVHQREGLAKAAMDCVSRMIDLMLQSEALPLRNEKRVGPEVSPEAHAESARDDDQPEN